MFTPYYILAVSFGAFATIVSFIGIKGKSDDFPGRFYGPIIALGVLFAIATFGFGWRGGEKEVEHREHLQHQQEQGVHDEGGGHDEHGDHDDAAQLPAGIKPSA